MDKINLLKKYAYTYLSKYDSTKKNLELKLKNKVMKMKNLESDEKNDLCKMIIQIIENLETNKVINDEYFASTKIKSLLFQGKSEIYIKNALLKKGVKKNIINKLLEDLEQNNPNWKVDSAKKFAKKKKIGIYGTIKNKKKDLGIMSRAGFKYHLSLMALGYD